MIAHCARRFIIRSTTCLTLPSTYLVYNYGLFSEGITQYIQ